MSSLRPSDIIHVMNVPWPSPFFIAILLPWVISGTQTESKMGKLGTRLFFSQCSQSETQHNIMGLPLGIVSQHEGEPGNRARL